MRMRALIQVRERPACGSAQPAITPSKSRLMVTVKRSARTVRAGRFTVTDRKSTRLNSSHANISYAVFCLKKKKHHDACPLDLADANSAGCKDNHEKIEKM